MKQRVLTPAQKCKWKEINKINTRKAIFNLFLVKNIQSLKKRFVQLFTLLSIAGIIRDLQMKVHWNIFKT